MKSKDQVIIAGIIEGNERILTCFYKENIKYIEGYILRNCGNTEDVEDIFQDALVLLYQKLRSGLLELRVPVRTYFYGICKNLWRNRLRKKKKLIIGDEHHFLEEEANDSIIIDIENQEREHLYRKYFQKLDTKSKKLLCLVFERKSMREISKITGYSEGYARKKKFEAKKELLRMIEEDPVYKELRDI
ncbi:RNA polymerase sigma factor [Aquimarina longa]|uniref:RNA polymerase sigma factor n=1 Tax=Aquimarina longa TaxID=1080221 RepID=UPI0007803543|nr:sigma-70 family RNA polymerase sigma factor [Aquimarina longa]